MPKLYLQKSNNGDIYKINYNEFKEIYIDKTNRRYLEYLRAYINKRNNFSNVVDRLITQTYNNKLLTNINLLMKR